MAQLTEAQRVARIQELLAQLHKMPPEKHETVRVPWTGDERQLVDVISIGVDEVLLNPESHRIRSQLGDDPAWAELKDDPFSDAAQRVIQRHVRESREAEDFEALKRSLVEDGQTNPGVMTHTGLLINANTRVVALREVEDPKLRYIRVAVLPSTAKAEELTLLELRLQMQKDLKEDYTMTNELLFIEELSVKRKLSPAQIARELRIADTPRKGEGEVLARLKYLDLIRAMQRIPTKPLPLTFFNTIKREQLREVHRTYTALLERDPGRAREHLESFLLSVAVGVKAVHEIRYVDADFMPEYMLPQLEDDPGLGQLARAIAAPADDRDKPARPPGVDALAPRDEEADAVPEVDVRRLVNVVTSREKRVEVPGTNVFVDRDDLKEALKTAVSAGIKDKRREKRDEDQLTAPVTAVKDATKRLARAKEALEDVANDPDFDDRRRKTLEAAYKRLLRTTRDLESALKKAGVLKG